MLSKDELTLLSKDLQMFGNQCLRNMPVTCAVYNLYNICILYSTIHPPVHIL